MQKKVLALSFLMAVIFSFISGYAFNNVYNVSFINRQSDIFQTISETLQNHYFYDVTEEDLKTIYINHIEKIVETFAEYYNDPYTRLETSDAFIASSNVGIGISIFFEGNIPVISSVLYTSDAFKKLYPGDKIKGIYENDQLISFETLTDSDEVINYLKGTLLQEKMFLIESINGTTRDVSIIYKDITRESISYAILNDQLSYIKISSFEPYQSETFKGTAHQFSEALTNLERNHLSDSQTLLIDLRDNPGGSLSALHNKGNSGLPIGIVQQLIAYDAMKSTFEFVDNNGLITKYYGGLETKKPYNIIVLVNERSASASEVLAASLESAGYTVYGQETFGKHVYQNAKNIAVINDQTFRLIYTEGQWTYDGLKSIETLPIKLTEMNLVNLNTSYRISYTKDLMMDDVSMDLADVQTFINRIFHLNIREDGYFDTETKNAIMSFQVVHNLNASGIYNYETYQALYNLYMTYINDVFLDLDIETLVNTYDYS
jgi:carboxyl-terminal processing protease